MHTPLTPMARMAALGDRADQIRRRVDRLAIPRQHCRITADINATRRVVDQVAADTTTQTAVVAAMAARYGEMNRSCVQTVQRFVREQAAWLNYADDHLDALTALMRSI